MTAELFMVHVSTLVGVSTNNRGPSPVAFPAGNFCHTTSPAFVTTCDQNKPSTSGSWKICAGTAVGDSEGAYVVGAMVRGECVGSLVAGDLLGEIEGFAVVGPHVGEQEVGFIVGAED
eukprot:CAMPEP_0184490016 /NCGR_PEP_ID=MMETSP0113_2-20130426/16927_1 /TAXON_ID=91329 /ORGANISM="Norrisiella sphaerica, Strain BC52" /LENGTH=117 /DNA_ID=CAMNT_0026873741 /DNA_START=427 /DNA_END=780 /DNA_ORIENTATION=+